MSETPIVLGQEYRDRITGFSGTAIAHTRHLVGRCDQALLAPRGYHNRLPRPEWIDAARLEPSTSIPMDAAEA